MERNKLVLPLYSRLFVIIAISILIMRLFYLQIVDKSYKRYSQRNTVHEIVRYPARGEIYDRNGVMIAQNKEAYDMIIVPNDMRAFDTLRLAKILNVEVEFLRERISKARQYSRRKETTLVAQLTHKTKLIIEELSIPGVDFLSHPVRNYTSQSVGNIFGYLGEVSQDDIIKDDYYTGGDYVGKTGLEYTYERELRGEKGFIYKMVDVHGVVRGDYDNGNSNVQPVQGMALKSTIDIVLQDLGVRLMKGKIGAIVAIEPSTGEVLAMVTAPSFSPDSLVGIDMGASYNKLVADPRRPLFNRSVMGGYSPGSTFKIANALLVLKDRVASPVERFDCNMGWSVTGRRVKCHAHASPVDMEFAIQTSCNAYFCATFRRLMRSGIHGGLKRSFDAWSSSIKQFGFGVVLDTDITGVQRGFIPDAAFYDKMYKGRWGDVTVISLSIGQGEITASPLQIANFTAIIANRGHYYMPHLVREVVGEDLQSRWSERHSCGVDPSYFDPIVAAMWKGVNVYGTGTSNSASLIDLDICGKSGTAQNSRGADHSTYVAFAPKDNPKIAIAVYVEHGGWGNTYGLPIATLMIEQYLRGEILRVELLEKIENMTIEYPNYDEINEKR